MNQNAKVTVKITRGLYCVHIPGRAPVYVKPKGRPTNAEALRAAKWAWSQVQARSRATRAKPAPVSRAKARLMLHHGTIAGRPITGAQRGMLGAIATGRHANAPKKGLDARDLVSIARRWTPPYDRRRPQSLISTLEWLKRNGKSLAGTAGVPMSGVTAPPAAWKEAAQILSNGVAKKNPPARRCNGCGYDVPMAGAGMARHRNPGTGQECGAARNPGPQGSGFFGTGPVPPSPPVFRAGVGKAAKHFSVSVRDTKHVGGVAATKAQQEQLASILTQLGEFPKKANPLTPRELRQLEMARKREYDVARATLRVAREEEARGEKRHAHGSYIEAHYHGGIADGIQKAAGLVRHTAAQGRRKKNLDPASMGVGAVLGTPVGFAIGRATGGRGKGELFEGMKKKRNPLDSHKPGCMCWFHKKGR